MHELWLPIAWALGVFIALTVIFGAMPPNVALPFQLLARIDRRQIRLPAAVTAEEAIGE